MGYAVKRDMRINARLRDFIYDNDKRPSRIADKAGIRRDTFSAIISCRRPIFADEIFSISQAAGCTIEYLLFDQQKEENQ